jgi:hypothetical protein
MRVRTTQTTPADRVSVARAAVPGFTVPQLTGAITLLLIAALVVPALAAHVVHQRRLARAVADLTRVATALRELAPEEGAGPWWSGGVTTAGAPIATLAGPGEMPKSPTVPEWLAGPSGALIDVLSASGALDPAGSTVGALHRLRLVPEIGVDPWGNRYLVNIGAARRVDSPGAGPRPPQAIWVLSAGSNGIIETPYNQPAAGATVGGDDVAVRVWR